MNDEKPIEERLPYPTQPMYFSDGTSVEEFIIAYEDKEIVLAQLYPFSPMPKLTDEMYDLHADKKFLVREFRVTWEHGMNYLVSPYYPESGGTVIDWMGENSWVDDEDYNQEDFEQEEDEAPDSKDDEIPF